jgi:predicted MFS family arabinose efflux permease
MVSRRSVIIFVIAIGFLGMADGISQTSFNNYLDSTFHITAEQRGDLELPREFPGFMVALLAGALIFMGDANLAAASSALIGLGMIGMAVLANRESQYVNMVIFAVAWSTGSHLMMPISQSLTLSLSEEGRMGEQLGRLGAVRAIATVVGCGLVIVNFWLWPQGFPTVFSLGAAAAVLAAFAFMALHRAMPAVHHSERRRMVLKKRYWLFYVLSVLYGARKQVFLTFGPWVLVRVFDQTPQTFAILWIIATGLTVVSLPWVGRMVDRVGPRVVLTADAVLLLLVCMTYGFARDLLPAGLAFFFVCGAYVMDQMLFPVQMARTVYLSRIAEDRRDVTPSLSMSISIDHAVSIPIAMLGGRLWLATGYRWVFAAAGAVALLMLAACQFIRVGPPHRDLTAGEAPA